MLSCTEIRRPPGVIQMRFVARNLRQKDQRAGRVSSDFGGNRTVHAGIGAVIARDTSGFILYS